MIQAAIRRTLAPGEESVGFTLDVEFKADKGITVLFGPSGAGKTLTLDALAGFVTPDAGRITVNNRLLFDGEAHVNVAPRHRSCGYVFQNYALFPHMTVRQNLAFAAYVLPRLERHRKISEALERWKLSAIAGRYPRELSGGQKQRASIARALMDMPKMLLLDEPGRALDGPLRKDLYREMEEMKRTLPLPIVLVTHDADECFALADQVLIYAEGRIVQRGAPLELLRNPGTAPVAQLLGNFNVFEAEVLALDPARQNSRIRMLGAEFSGPNLRGCFKGDRVMLAVRPEELKIAGKPGDNRIRLDPVHVTERSQGLRLDFGDGVFVDASRADWHERGDAVWVEFPSSALRLLSRT